jgi:hypothetical protein|tara:strand:+ start:1380 stop:1637 length:258 start_codon:yes stop_codon:yes gene_type:complete
MRDGARSAQPRSNPTWAMLIKRIYEVDPLICTQCGSRMKVVAFIELRQGQVIEKILRAVSHNTLEYRARVLTPHCKQTPQIDPFD